MRIRKSTINADTAALDWLETFGGTAEFDDILGLWTVHPREPGYPPRSGRTLRAAAARAMSAAAALDAAAPDPAADPALQGGRGLYVMRLFEVDA